MPPLQTQLGELTVYQESMNFIETAQYNAPPVLGNSSQMPLPDSWYQCQHPNGDIYFFNAQLRLLTPDNIRDSDILGYVIDAREDHLQCLEGDANLDTLPMDYELVISDVNDTTAVLRMYSRSAGQAYEWTEERGLTAKSREHFWSYVAEFPSHHQNLPLNTEAEFVRALNNAQQAIRNGTLFAFSETQLDQIASRYQTLTELRSQGENVTASLAWLVGAVMPLEAIGQHVDDRGLDALMNNMHF